MLLFHCVPDGDIEEIRKRGVSGEVVLGRSFSSARDACSGKLLVVNPLKLPVDVDWEGVEAVTVQDVPVSAIVNLNPYLPPAAVTAGGGYVMREANSEPEVLMIYRRGVWDLPKGKLDAGESEEECALREVREEVGISDLEVVRPLGVTVHGYERKGQYKVKTTYWYQMYTPETDFVPQAEEEIEQVRWVPWSDAVCKIGYETFRRHMRKIEKVVT